MANKKKILWICDIKGWAFYNRSSQLINLLPDYEHDIIFYDPEKHIELIESMENYDIIVSWSVSMISTKYRDKMIIGLTGGRVQMTAFNRILNNIEL